MRSFELPDAFVVFVQNGDPVRLQCFDEFALRRGDVVDRFEVLDMGVADVRHHCDIGWSDAAECADLAGVIHAVLEYSYLRFLRDPQHRERQANVIVEVADRLADSHGRAEDGCDDVLGRCFTRAARYADHFAGPPFHRPLRQLLQRNQRVLHPNQTGIISEILMNYSGRSPAVEDFGQRICARRVHPPESQRTSRPAAAFANRC